VRSPRIAAPELNQPTGIVFDWVVVSIAFGVWGWRSPQMLVLVLDSVGGARLQNAMGRRFIPLEG
jgi:hypothetical protein